MNLVHVIEMLDWTISLMDHLGNISSFHQLCGTKLKRSIHFHTPSKDDDTNDNMDIAMRLYNHKNSDQEKLTKMEELSRKEA